METFLLVIVMFTLMAAYLLPALVATVRGVRTGDAIGITLFVVIAGWTIVGWLLALIWSFAAQTRREDRVLVLRERDAL